MTNEELQKEMIAAMKAKDKVRLSIIRQVKAEVKNIEVNERRDVTEEEDVNSMIKRLIKQTSERGGEPSRPAPTEQSTPKLSQEVVKMLGELPAPKVSGEGAPRPYRAGYRRAWRHVQEADGPGYGRPGARASPPAALR